MLTKTKVVRNAHNQILRLTAIAGIDSQIDLPQILLVAVEPVDLEGNVSSIILNRKVVVPEMRQITIVIGGKVIDTSALGR